MKTYIVALEFPTNFYPPLTSKEVASLLETHLFAPVRDRAAVSNREIVVKEELGLVGKMIILATEKAARDLRSLGYHLQIKKTP